MTRIVSFGGGLNSTAMLIGLASRAVAVDAVLFADTGGEFDETYAHVAAFSDWCVVHGLPPITVVRANGETLEANCLRRKALPSVAYGFKTCSQRWKSEPQEKWCNNWSLARETWDRDELIEKLIGFDVDESGRAKPYRDSKFVNRYPLIEWNYGRDECAEIVAAEGMSVSKSSCFFCPNRSKSEFRQMQETHPEHLARAIAMEDNADLTHIKGLKRDYSLRQLLANGELFSFEPEQCDTCYDGESASQAEGEKP